MLLLSHTIYCRCTGSSDAAAGPASCVNLHAGSCYVSKVELNRTSTDSSYAHQHDRRSVSCIYEARASWEMGRHCQLALEG